ncbi:MAG: SGNH/GDSL hydrolase family protein, partial [Bacteroidota bacterium]
STSPVMHRKYLLLCIVLMLFILNCDKQSTTTMEETIETPPPVFTYLALGDSYTIGESVEESERWPVQLAARLQADSIELREPHIIARTGWTTGELDKAIDDSEVVDSTFSMVSLLIGVNNQFRGYDFEAYKVEFRNLLQRALQFAGGNKDMVFVVSIPDYGVTPFGERYDPEKIAREIDQYNAFNQEVAVEMGIQYFDITPISRKAKEDASLIANDKLHPSGEMYTQWVELIYPTIKEWFAR